MRDACLAGLAATVISASAAAQSFNIDISPVKAPAVQSQHPKATLGFVSDPNGRGLRGGETFSEVLRSLRDDRDIRLEPPEHRMFTAKPAVTIPGHKA